MADFTRSDLDFVLTQILMAEAKQPPVNPLLSFGLRATIRQVAPASLRDVPLSPDGGVIADYHGPVEDPAALAARLSATPGVVAHGLFPPQLVAMALIGRGESADPIDFTAG